MPANNNLSNLTLRTEKGAPVTFEEMDNNFNYLYSLQSYKQGGIGPEGPIGLDGKVGITFSIEEPVNPDLNPENTTWFQIDQDTNLIINMFKYVNGSWDIQEEYLNVWFGYNYVVVQKLDGSYWGKGENVNGQFGLGHFNQIIEFTLLPIPNNSELFIGLNHILYITPDSNRDLMSCGIGAGWDNGSPSGFTTKRNTFLLLTGFSNPKQVFSGLQLIVQKQDDTVWVCGSNWSGALGINSNFGPNTLYQHNYIPNFKKAYVTNTYSQCVYEKLDGTLWIAGYHTVSASQSTTSTLMQLPSVLNNPIDVICGPDSIIFITSDYHYYGLGVSDISADYSRMGFSDILINPARLLENIPQGQPVDQIISTFNGFLLRFGTTIYYTGDNNDSIRNHLFGIDAPNEITFNSYELSTFLDSEIVNCYTGLLFKNKHGRYYGSGFVLNNIYPNLTQFKL